MGVNRKKVLAEKGIADLEIAEALNGAANETSNENGVPHVSLQDSKHGQEIIDSEDLWPEGQAEAEIEEYFEGGPVSR